MGTTAGEKRWGVVSTSREHYSAEKSPKLTRTDAVVSSLGHIVGLQEETTSACSSWIEAVPRAVYAPPFCLPSLFLCQDQPSACISYFLVSVR